MAEFDAPQSRNEAILQNMLGANNELGEPESRIEELLQQILEQGQGGKKYNHCLSIQSGLSLLRLTTIICTDDNTPMDYAAVYNWLKRNDIRIDSTTFKSGYNASGHGYDSTIGDLTIIGIGYTDDEKIECFSLCGNNSYKNEIRTDGHIIDLVIEI